MTILITGGAGFIGSNFLIDWLVNDDENVINLDKVNYEGNLNKLCSLENNYYHLTENGHIGKSTHINDLISLYHPRAIIDFVKESNVDRSIHVSEIFTQFKFIENLCLLECAKDYWLATPDEEKFAFLYLFDSTDEVYGSLDKDVAAYAEMHRYETNISFSASKASSDHPMRTYYHPYELRVLSTNYIISCESFQFPETLIPHIIHNALMLKAFSIYSDGMHIPDWLYAIDHNSIILDVLDLGRFDEDFKIGDLNVKANVDIVLTLCDILFDILPLSYSCELITKFKDCPCNNYRYAFDTKKNEINLNSRPIEIFEGEKRKKVERYLYNPVWLKQFILGEYCQWVERY